MGDVLVDGLKAADVMQRDVIVVSARDTLKEALALMTENHVTGLPVVDRQGHCVGVVTATDILGYEQDHADEEGIGDDHVTQYFDPDTEQWESVRVGPYALERLGEVAVQDVMAADIVSVAPSTSLREVARLMAAERIHRVVVLNEESRICGIVSSFDFVKRVAESG